ncbi:MAG TPA: thioredoxin family protein [Armatimonadota bacterium]|nr:thioredoxin family protein [Armatimonadota bacterium]
MVRSIICIVVLFCLCVVPVFSAENAGQPKVVDSVYRGLSMGLLRQARLTTLPPGIVLRSGQIQITQQDIDAAIAKMNIRLQGPMKQHAFFVLESIAAPQFLLLDARAWAERIKLDTSQMSDSVLTYEFNRRVIGGIPVVTEAERHAFYREHKDDMFNGDDYDAVIDDLVQLLQNAKQHQTLNTYIRTISQRYPIELDAAWTQSVAANMLTTPLDKARRTGKPVLANFVVEYSLPCETMKPIMNEFKQNTQPAWTVLSIAGEADQFVNTRYDITTWPTQIIFDKNGNEVYRHAGVITKQRLLEQMKKVAGE